MFHCTVVYNRSGWSPRASWYIETDEAMLRVEMGRSLNKLHIWNQQTMGNLMMVFSSWFYRFFENLPIFHLHFQYDIFHIFETFWLKNVRSGHGDRFPKGKQESDKKWENYEWILHSVPIFLGNTLNIYIIHFSKHGYEAFFVGYNFYL